MNLRDILNPEPHYASFTQSESECLTPSHLLLLLRNPPPIHQTPAKATSIDSDTDTDTDKDNDFFSGSNPDSDSVTFHQPEGDAEAETSGSKEGNPRRKERNWRWVSQTAVKKVPARKKNPNSYILFCLDQRENVRRAFPRLSHREVTAKLGQLWRDKSPQEKDDFCRRMRAQIPYRLSS